MKIYFIIEDCRLFGNAEWYKFIYSLVISISNI